MGIEFETRKESNTLVKWSFVLPCYGNETSNKVIVYGYEWFFEFKADRLSGNSLKEDWWLMLYYLADPAIGTLRPFPLKVYIRIEGCDIYLSQKEISSTYTVIWSCRYSDFIQKFHSVQLNYTVLEFVFDFNLGRPDPVITREEKSIQTSYSYADTKYTENHPCLENLSLDLSKLIEGGTDTDVQVKCGDVLIGAHKGILSARSEVFHTMMHTDMVEKREGIVEIKDMEPQILKLFIKYIYTGILHDLNVDTVLPIYEAADKYQVEALKKRSCRLLLKNLSPLNCLSILVTADAHSDSMLKDQLLHYILKEKITNRKAEWLKFCNEYPKLANEVLNFMIYQ